MGQVTEVGNYEQFSSYSTNSSTALITTETMKDSKLSLVNVETKSFMAAVPGIRRRN